MEDDVMTFTQMNARRGSNKPHVFWPATWPGENITAYVDEVLWPDQFLEMCAPRFPWCLSFQ